MADYSGHVDPWGLSLTSTWIKRPVRDLGIDSEIYGSHKDFRRDGPYISVPADLLGYLIDGHYAGVRKTRVQAEVPKIKWDQKYRQWQLSMRIGHYFSNKDGIEWLIRHGYLERDNNGKLKVLKDF